MKQVQIIATNTNTTTNKYKKNKYIQETNKSNTTQLTCDYFTCRCAMASPNVKTEDVKSWRPGAQNDSLFM